MAKPLIIRCRDADHVDGGYATITIAGLADYRGDGRLIVRRFDRPEQFLGRHGWQVAEASLKPRDMQSSGGQLVLTVGPEMVDYMETGLSVQIQMVDGAQAGALVWTDVAPSILRGSDQRNIAGKQVVAGDPLSRQLRDGAARRQPPPESPQAQQPAVAGPSAGAAQRLGAAERAGAAAPFHDARTVVVGGPRAAKPNEDPPTIKPGAAHASVIGGQGADRKKSSGSGVLVAVMAGGVAALILAGGAWVYVTCPAWAPICSAFPPSAGPADPLADAPPCPADKLIRDASARPLDEVHRDAVACQKRGEWSVALGALQIAVSRGHGPSATAMAGLYDPATFKPGGFLTQADPYEAARYFRLAVDLGDTSASPARETLRQYLVQQSAQGSTAAKLALQNYW